MIAVLKGDIVQSRKLDDQELWLLPLKTLLKKWGDSPGQWEVVWGDSFQLEIQKSEEALKKAFQIKALIKKIRANSRKKSQRIDVRMAIGIGEKSYSAEKISESNGPAFIFAGEKFEKLKKEKLNIGLKTRNEIFDEEMNLYLKLSGLFMDKWTVPSAELIEIVLQKPELTQKEIGLELGIKQNSVSARWNRANVDEVLAVEKIFRKKLKALNL